MIDTLPRIIGAFSYLCKINGKLTSEIAKL